MAQKKVWVTWLPGGEGAASPDTVIGSLSQAGLDVAGAHWVDDLEKAAWMELGGLLLDEDKADLWLIVGRKTDIESTRVRYGLSLVTAMLDARQSPLTGIVAGLDFEPEAQSLPTMLRPFQCIDSTQGAWAAKVVAAAFGNADEAAKWDCRFNVIAHPMMGQWFEVGPRDAEWHGALFGVTGGEANITHHAVGPCGQLPEKSMLAYPTQGIKAEVGGSEFTAWSVQNVIDCGSSYYLKVEGFPDAVIIGANPASNEAEVTRLVLV